MELEAQQMRCPKCGHPQPESETCRQCGIVFHKYMESQQRPQPRVTSKPASRFPFRLAGRILKLTFLASLMLALWAYWQKDQLPPADFFHQAPLADPLQTDTSTKPFEIEANDIVYRIEPVADYELQGMVVSYHDSDALSDIYHHKDWKDFINIRDLCVIWGDNLSSEVYREMEFENATWTCWVYWPNREVANRFRMRQLSNNHLLAHDPAVHQAIMEAEPGDHIRFKGMLARYSHSNGAFERGTSTSRTDTGNGACETVFVEDFEIVQKANPGWRQLHTLALFLMGLSFLGLLAVLSVAPVTRHSSL